MNGELRYTRKVVFAVLQWVRKEIMDEVPPHFAVCEFDCDKTRCTFQ
jgi:hypothetical protein